METRISKKKGNFAQKMGRWCAAGLLTAGLFSASASATQTYTITIATDFTGPFADVMESWHGSQLAIINWWNETRGKELGVKVEPKAYDMRYDASEIAKRWPSIVSSDEPIVHLGMGGPDLVSLMKRLPNDKIPMIMGTAMLGQVWTPNGWHFSPRPTYSHEFAGMFEHLRKRLNENRPLRIGAVSTAGIAPWEDQVNGVVKLAEISPDKFEMAEIVSVPRQPVSITNEIHRLMRSKPDVILTGTTTAHVVATLRALQELGHKVPVVTSSHNGLTEVAKSIDMPALEGSFSVFSMAPFMEEDIEARAIFDKYKPAKATWGQTATQSAAQTILALRVLERAIEKVGADKVTGQAMYDALLSGPYEASSLLGLLPTVQFGKDAPFPTNDLKAKAFTVKDGQFVSVSKDWMPVPAIPKW